MLSKNNKNHTQIINFNCVGKLFQGVSNETKKQQEEWQHHLFVAENSRNSNNTPVVFF